MFSSEITASRSSLSPRDVETGRDLWLDRGFDFSRVFDLDDTLCFSPVK